MIIRANTFTYRRYKRKLIHLENIDARVADIITYLNKLELVKNKMFADEFEQLKARAYYYMDYTKRRLNI